MNKKKINNKITEVFMELSELLAKEDLTKSIANKEIRRLYREYLKLYVKICRMIPEYEEGRFKGNINCYFYALDLPLPNVFSESFESITNLPFCTNLGEISALKYFRHRFLVPTSTDLLDYVYTDLDTLKINAYDSAINLPIRHNGYKIAIFFENNKRRDYHFVRQNSDGSWSSKIGYEELIVKSDNPFDYLNDNLFDIKTNYEYVKTLELVKPSIKR